MKSYGLEYVGPSGERVIGQADFVLRYADICRKQEEEERALIRKLRSEGIKAAHPNDGWIDRENQTFHFSYPLFDDGYGIGDKVALISGLTQEVTIVKVTGETGSLFHKRWEYKLVVTNP